MAAERQSLPVSEGAMAPALRPILGRSARAAVNLEPAVDLSGWGRLRNDCLGRLLPVSIALAHLKSLLSYKATRLAIITGALCGEPAGNLLLPRAGSISYQLRRDAAPRRENLAWENRPASHGRVADAHVQVVCGQRRRRMSQACSQHPALPAPPRRTVRRTCWSASTWRSASP